MAIDVQCVNCGEIHRAQDSLTGRKLRCKECGADLRVPQPRFADDKKRADDGYVSEPAPVLHKRSRSRNVIRGKDQSNDSLVRNVLNAPSHTPTG